MNEKKTRRGMILASAAITGGVTGSIYMWSIFKIPLMEANGWTSNEVTLAYSLFILAVCVFGFAAGPLQRKVKPNIIVLIAGIGFGLGWFLTSYAKTTTQLYIFFSLIAGASDGFIYNTAVSTATKWFPDKKGFANGICIGCMGLAPLIFAPMGNFFIEKFGAWTSFRVCGVIFMVCYLVFAWFIKSPEDGWKPEGWTPTPQQVSKQGRDLNAGSMLKTPSFWILWVLFAVAASSGMMMTGHASGIGQQLASLTAAQASVQVGILALANFVGRFGFGSISDRLGRYNTLLILLVVTAIDMIFFFSKSTSFVSFTIALSVVGACFGGVMTILPSLCSDNFGSKNFGLNYAFLYSGYTCASFIGPMLASNVVQSTGVYDKAFVIAGALSAVGIVLVLAAKAVQKKTLVTK